MLRWAPRPTLFGKRKVFGEAPKRHAARALPRHCKLRSLISRHEKNANATSVAIIDAIAVANAELHADFK